MEDCYIKSKVLTLRFNNKKLHLHLITIAYIQSRKRIISFSNVLLTRIAEDTENDQYVIHSDRAILIDIRIAQGQTSELAQQKKQVHDRDEAIPVQVLRTSKTSLTTYGSKRTHFF